MSRVTLNLDLNRVEGDLEFEVDVEDGVVVEARCIGTLYRGFEQIMIGRAPTDSLVITPRVCGICSTAHLYAAVLALENLAGIVPPAHAVLLRNLCQLAETVQSDLRQSFLFFTPDFCHPRYAGQPLAGELQAAFANLKGSVVRGALQASRELLGVVAIFGGQWPHSSWMLPGGVSQPANPRRLIDAQQIVGKVGAWFEDAVLGDRLADFLALDDAGQLWRWLDDSRHAAAGLGLFTRFARQIGLQHGGGGSPQLLGYGLPALPDGSPPLLPGGFFDAASASVQPLDHRQIAEHVRHSWFRPYPGGRHPWQGETVPDYQPGGDRYTWAKAPRYAEQVVQSGPLADLRLAGDPLIADLLAQEGDNTWLRQFARLRRSARALRDMAQLLDDLKHWLGQPHFVDPAIARWPDGEGYGLTTAARGALGHWLSVRDGAIERYQIITPTSWNASPRDSDGEPGHWERSLVGMRIADPADPLEIGHVVRSHDPCLVCTVHFIGQAGKISFHV